MKSSYKINIGDRFGSLTVTSRNNQTQTSGRDSHRIMWNCKCDCGTFIVTSGSNLRTNRKQRCNDCAWMDRTIKSKRIVTQIEQLYNNRIVIRCRDSKKEIENNLSIDEFEKLVNMNCYYCGKEPTEISMFSKRKYSNSEILKVNGVDRINSSVGYSKDNCVPCCSECNTMKMDLPIDLFLDKIDKIYHYSIIRDL